MKRMLILATVLLSAFLVSVSASAANGWAIDDPSGVNAEICDCNSLSGKAIHIENIDSDDITVSHMIAGTGAVRRNYRVTFYMKGEYDEAKIMVGTGTKTTGSNPDVITYMPVSHEKVQKSDFGNGWTKYTYVFRGNIANNSIFKFVFQNGSGTVYVDNVSIVFDNATDGAFLPVGQGLLADGEFEDEITADTGLDIGEFGWTSNINSAPTTGDAVGGVAITPVARVVEGADGNRMLYAKYNSNAWTSGITLTKTIEKVGWEYFYISFKVKGAFYPNSVEVGSKYDEHLKKLVGANGSSEENPYGDDVVAEVLEDGWTRYTVKTYGEGTEIRIKIHSHALEMYFDDFEVVTEAGVHQELKNPGFENIDYASEKVFAEKWTAENVNEKAFAQREKMKENYAIFLTSNDANNKSGFYQTIDSVTIGDVYTVSFDAKSSFAKSGIKVGFGTDLETVSGQEFIQIGKAIRNYSFDIPAASDKFIFATSGVCDGVWIDNVSVTDVNGNELIINGDFEIKTQPPVYTVENVKLLKGGVETPIGQGSYVVTAEVENNFGDDNMEFTVIVSHDRNGEMIKYSVGTISLNPNGEDGETSLLQSAPIDLSDYANGDTLEVYIWDNDTNQNSLFPYVCFK